MSMLETKALTLCYDDRTIIDSLDVSVPEGEITVLIGANGCGKSTLLRSMARLLKPASGTVLLHNESIKDMPAKHLAKQLSILPQGPVAPEGLTVFQLVKQGRYPHQSFFKQWSREDEHIVKEALKATGLDSLSDHPVDALSGGQRQRAWIAMTLAQKTDLILLDEPTTYLDMAHQIDILDLLFRLNEQEGRTVVMVLHDINLACRYAHHLIAVQNKTVYAEGKPEDIVSAQLIKDVFNMNCMIAKDPLFGTPMCIPHGQGRHI